MNQYSIYLEYFKEDWENLNFRYPKSYESVDPRDLVLLRKYENVETTG